MLIKIYSKDTNERHILQVVEILRNGGIVICPTDTIYALVCSLHHIKGIEEIQKLLARGEKNVDFSLICNDLSQLSNYTKPISNSVFKLMKRNLPGPFTFILPANGNIPKLFKTNKKTVGIRVPNNPIIRRIVEILETPLISASIHDSDQYIEYTTDPELIHERFETKVDLVIDGGFGGNIPSTIIDCTEQEIVILREGLGIVEY